MRPAYGSWYRALKYSQGKPVDVGFRSSQWIKSFETDIVGWGFHAWVEVSREKKGGRYKCQVKWGQKEAQRDE